MGRWFRAERRRKIGYTVADLIREQTKTAVRLAEAERRMRNAQAMHRVAAACR